VSPLVLSEYFDTIEELASRHPDRLPVPWAERLTEAADLVFPVDRAHGETTDPDDEMFLECALAGKVQFIVSGATAHQFTASAFEFTATPLPGKTGWADS
jgi:predicted nucleic acid-binding protein